MTQAVLKSIPPLYATEHTPLEDKVIHVKFFQPWGAWTWYGVEYDPETKIFFGYVVGFESEWGNFSLEELESIKGPAGLKIERDIHFKPVKFSELKD